MSKLRIDRYVSGWGDAEPCPCDSGEAFSRCCQREKHRPPVMQLPILRPPGALTGYAHPKCYMRASADCSEKVSREHYISHGVLKQLGGLTVRGMPWQAPGQQALLSADALTAKVLCERHNSALSPLDDLASKAFEKISQAANYSSNGRHRGRVRHYFVSGDGLEIWAVKVFAGVYEAGIAAHESKKVKDFGYIDYERVAELLSGQRVQSDGGLFVTQNPGDVHAASVNFAPLVADDGQAVGARLQFGSLQFDVVIVAPAAGFLAAMKERHRPTVIDFNGPHRTSRVVLSWDRNVLRVKRIGIEIEPSPSAIT